LNVGIQQRYVSSGSYDATFGAADLADRHVRAATYTTLRLAFSPRGGRGTTWYLNIQNLFEAAPPTLGRLGLWRVHSDQRRTVRRAGPALRGRRPTGSLNAVLRAV
jgi:hypothetical protein